MTWPDYPNNRLIVDGVDLSIRFQMVLLDGYKLSPPEIKTYLVDIPGSNGSIDLTEALTGDVAYGNREQEFTFMVVNPHDFESVKTDVSNFLHGRSFDYQMTMDPDYTYHGRFEVTDYDHSYYSWPGIVGVFAIKVSADPYKRKRQQSYVVNAIGGQTFQFQSGRKPVHPTVQTDRVISVRWNEKEIRVPVGTWILNDVVFRQGANQLYINSARILMTPWSDIMQGGAHAMTWEQMSKYRWDELAHVSVQPGSVPRSWQDLQGHQWKEYASTRWSDMNWVPSQITTGADEADDADKPYNVYITYDWEDL